MEIFQPICAYFTGKVAFLDDQSAFLDSLALRLPDSLNFQMETNPNTVLDFINAQPSLQLNILQKIEITDLEKPVDCPINVNVTNIRSIMLQAKRFSHYTVLVVDQFMPQMNGIEVCEKLSQHPIKKIMLTSKANNQLAINAFNKGIIDHFIAKDEQDIVSHLQFTILNLQQKYFQKWSAPVIEAIKTVSDSFLKSTKFIPEFNIFIKKYAICEFYLLDTIGSYVGLDSEGNTYYFLVKSKTQMDYYIDIVKNSSVNKDILTALKERRKLPYFFNETQEQANIEQWENMLHNINKCVDTFYIAMTKSNYALKQNEEFISFKQYLEKNSVYK